jgi:hypothetical protein
MEMYAAHYPPGYDFPISTLFLDVLGELVQTTAGEWITHPPTRCPNGHTLGPGQVLVGHQACLGHGGHTSWTCRTSTRRSTGHRSTYCMVLDGRATVRISTKPD